MWVLPKGGYEEVDRTLETAAQREALEEAGVRGVITRYVTTISASNATYHFYELDVTSLDDVWMEAHERRREWVDFGTALARLKWKPELLQAFSSCSLAPSR